MAVLNLVGQKFGKLTVIALESGRTTDDRKWRCVCDCGGEKVTSEDNLKRGHCKSCGCLYKNNGGSEKKNIPFGSTSKLYNVWQNMRSRCKNPKDNNYKKYGARGITVCKEWDSYPSFREWALSNGYKEGENRRNCTIDRIDVDGNYEPNNCRWATAFEQVNNRRNTIRIEFNGETHALAQWAKETGIDYEVLLHRYIRGWSAERMLTQPVRTYRKER